MEKEQSAVSMATGISEVLKSNLVYAVSFVAVETEPGMVGQIRCNMFASKKDGLPQVMGVGSDTLTAFLAALKSLKDQTENYCLEQESQASEAREAWEAVKCLQVIAG